MNLNLNMDWTDFQILYWFFKKSGRVLYLGEIDLLNFTLLNAEEVYLVTPQKINLKNPRLKKFEENPEYLNLSDLPRSFDRIINFLPMNIVTSFKIMGRFVGLLGKNKKLLIKVEAEKKQMKYCDIILDELLPKLNLEKVMCFEMEGNKYVIGKKL